MSTPIPISIALIISTGKVNWRIERSRPHGEERQLLANSCDEDPAANHQAE